MDVKCEKCGTEYEFDDAKVTEAGITVKCTNCGHLFRVVRHRVVFDESPVASEPEPEPAESRTPSHQWRIRTGGGDVHAFKDLATLQQWIVQGKVARDDQISKTGDNWKPLGSIVELASFFPGEDTPAPAPMPADRDTVPLTPAPGPAPPPPQSRSDLLDTGEFRLEGPDDRPTIRTPAIDVQRTSPAHRATPGPQRVARRAPPPPPPTPPPSVAVTRTPPPGLRAQATPMSFDGELPPGYRPAGSATARGFLIGVLATVALAGVAYFVWDQINDRSGPRGPRTVGRTGAPEVGDARARIEQGEAALRADTTEGLSRAEAAFSTALGALGEPPSDAELALRARLGLAAAAVTAAEYQRLEGKDAAPGLEKALVSLASARALAPDDARVALGFADYYRVAGQLDSARRQLERAESGGAPRPAIELLRAALEVHVDGADAAATSRKLAALSADARRLPRAQYLQAVAYRRAGRDEDATQTLVELVAANKGHAPGSRMLEQLGAAPRGRRGDDGGGGGRRGRRAAAEPHPPAHEQKPPSKAPEPPAPEPEPAAKPAPPEPPPTKRAAPPAPESYDVMLSRGYKLLERGRSAQARHLFEQAAQSRPQSPEPWANLGWCDLDTGRLISAVDNFKRSLNRNPRYADGMYGLAVAYEKAGRTMDAIRSYQAYLDAHPRGRKAGMVQRKLERLR
ncbi:MAG: zinc-ribbon domain-containing protein [Myxococcales bacterium]|nr:zinc-ribbon domain-containing protein [Myxococcales bacterium]